MAEGCCLVWRRDTVAPERRDRLNGKGPRQKEQRAPKRVQWALSLWSFSLARVLTPRSQWSITQLLLHCLLRPMLPSYRVVFVRTALCPSKELSFLLVFTWLVGGDENQKYTGAKPQDVENALRLYSKATTALLHLFPSGTNDRSWLSFPFFYSFILFLFSFYFSALAIRVLRPFVSRLNHLSEKGFHTISYFIIRILLSFTHGKMVP